MNKRTILKASAAVVLVLATLLAGAAAYVQHLLSAPYKSYSGARIAVTISPGSSGSSISRMLHQKGVLHHPWLLKGIFLYRKTQGKSGDYVFDRPMTPWEVYEKLMKGETRYTLLTVPEGSNLFDIERILESKNICTKDSFRLALQSGETNRAIEAIEHGLTGAEGFLFPDTYFLSKRELDPQRIILLMIKQFQKVFGDAEQRRAGELQMTVREAVTLASLVEKETGQPSERALISGVFHNRLTRSMLLQCDPTVIYALLLNGNHDGHISRTDLRFTSPYNTYVSPGLPPGPICNPGKHAILAALYPEQTEMLYFVSRNDGSHQFSPNLQEHNRAVMRYQRRGT